MAKKKERFKEKYNQGVFQTYQIVVDTETGVNYLITTTGVGTGVTPLIDRDGKPIISSSSEFEKE